MVYAIIYNLRILYEFNVFPYLFRSGLTSQRVFHTNGLMRMRLTAESSKMILCTAGGYLMVVHNLDFATLNRDLAGFKPNMYRLMQISQAPISIATSFSNLFSSKRNRVELISDWPDGNEAEVVSALQVHPSGWCVISRNTSNSDHSEWTCVHDIQDVPICPVKLSRKRPRDESESNKPSPSHATPVASSSTSPSDTHGEESVEVPSSHLTIDPHPGTQVSLALSFSFFGQHCFIPNNFKFAYRSRFVLQRPWM